MNKTHAHPNIQNIIKHWKYIANDIREPLNIDDYNKLAAILDQLLDIVGENEDHKFMGLVDFVSHMIALYEERKQYEIKNVSGIDVLKFLMEQHHLRQSDLPEIGSQGVVSEVLKGKRSLNVKQIKKLAKRFHVTPNTFI